MCCQAYKRNRNSRQHGGRMELIMTGQQLKIRKHREIRRAFRAAFPHTIPIFAGFWFLGLTYGIYMNVSGFSFIYPMLMSITIFAGSMEFVTVNLLLGHSTRSRHLL